jgi:integrase
MNRTSVSEKLLAAAEPHPLIKMRILLVLGAGLRRSDIDSLKISGIDFENNYITTTSKKTRKSMGSRPVPAEVIAELSKYVFQFLITLSKSNSWSRLVKIGTVSFTSGHVLFTK